MQCHTLIYICQPTSSSWDCCIFWCKIYIWSWDYMITLFNVQSTTLVVTFLHTVSFFFSEVNTTFATCFHFLLCISLNFLFGRYHFAPACLVLKKLLHLLASWTVICILGYFLSILTWFFFFLQDLSSFWKLNPASQIFRGFTTSIKETG